jgi:FkbH-like protein
MNKAKIVKILAEVLEINDSELSGYNETVLLEYKGLDSIKFIKAVVRFEEEFGIEINDSDLLMANFATLENVYKTLKKYLFKENILKKVLITDCDNVLWCGVAGEEELFVDDTAEKYQKELLRLYNNGVLICICSRNEKANIDQAFERLLMTLERKYILSEIINRNDKAVNVLSLAAELNLSPSSFVFVDDSNYELGLVESIIPGITVIKAESKTTEWIDDLTFLFDTSQGGSERTRQYIEQKEREKEKLHFDSVDAYNSSLKTVITCEKAKPEQAERIAELSQRTNQFNLAESRYTSDEVTAMINDDKFCVLSLSASDKYGDMGIVGSAVIRYETDAVIKAFMLSCRVFDRGFESIMMSNIKELAGSRKLYGVFHPNGKNKHYTSFYEDNGVMKI